MVTRGRLAPAADAPEVGETTTEILRMRNLVVEQILSGRVQPDDYLQEHDEWVVVLEGAATLVVAGETVELQAGDWLLVPAMTPHRLVEATPGTNWLALHLH